MRGDSEVCSNAGKRVVTCKFVEGVRRVQGRVIGLFGIMRFDGE